MRSAAAIGDEGVPFREITEVIGKHLDLPVVGIPGEKARGHSGLFALFAVAGFDIRQLTDVSHCKLQHHLSRNRRQGRVRAARSLGWPCSAVRQAPYPGLALGRQTSRRHVTGNAPYRADTRFLTIFEVAVILRVSKRTVYRLVHDGDLEAIRVDGSFRIPERAIRPQASS